MLKNKIFGLLIITALSVPVFSQAETEDAVQPIVEEETQVLNTIDEEVPETIDSQKFKQPVSKRKIAKKFLLAMAGVGVSSLLIYGGLSVYNRVRENLLPEESVKEPSLETPENINDAIKSFIEKTRWD